MKYSCRFPKRLPFPKTDYKGWSHSTLVVITACMVLAGFVSLLPATSSTVIAMPGTTNAMAQNLPRGEISHPAPSPSNPDIIAYTKKDGNRHYLHLHHVATGVDERIVHQTRREQTIQSRIRSVTRNRVESLMQEAGLPSGYFEGDFVWRPGLDQFGYQWFAFVATQAGKIQLHLGYITSGETLRTVVFPLGFGNVVTNPAFSPDGSALVFSVDGQLHIETDIGKVIRKRDFRRMQPRRITGHTSGSYFPSWSADGSMIAYQSRPIDGRRAGYESIFVMDVTSLTEGRLPSSFRVSIDDEDGGLFHHLRPSWDPSGKFLAWYEQSELAAELPEEEPEAEAETIRSNEDEIPLQTYPEIRIRLVRVEFDSNRNAWVGLPLQRAARRFFAEPVYAFQRSAPHWTTIEYDRRPADGIIWVRYAPDLDHPLHFSHLDYYSDNRQDFSFNMFSFSNRFQWLERTSRNRYPAAARAGGHTRYVYVAEHDGRKELMVADRQATEMRPVIRKEFNEVSAVIRGGLYPGLGHFHIGENRKGAWLTSTFSVLAGATVTTAVLRYLNDEAKPDNNILIPLGAATGITWTFGILNLRSQFPAYREVPVLSTFEGYREDIIHDHPYGYDRINAPSRRDAMMLSALYPGLGQIYIGERNKGYAFALTFTALAGSSLAGAAYRYHYPGQTPSNEVLIGLGAATVGIWILNLVDLQQSFSNSFFAANVPVDGAGSTSQTSARRTEIAVAPRVEYLRIGNDAYREYASIGLSFSF